MSNNQAIVGRPGEKANSDCHISLQLHDKGEVELELDSKVATFYGDDICELVRAELDFFDIKSGRVTVEDYGAVPFVMQARLETVIKRIRPDITTEYLPTMSEKAICQTERDRFRRSRLYLPGNYPKFMLNAGLHRPDSVILDLEDSVAPAEKDAARLLVRNALRRVDFFGAERMVRINQLPRGLDDLNYIIHHNVHVVLIPKCEAPEDIKRVNLAIEQLNPDGGEKVFLMPIVESALGVLNAYEIASAADNVVALAIGLEDYTADLGVARTVEGKESLWARSMIVNAACAAGVQAIDTVFSDVDDMDGLRASVLESRAMGYVGKGCIHPRQIKVVHDAFAPTSAEIERAKAIVAAYRRAEAKGLGVVSLGSKMLDPPVVKRAIRVIELAISMDLLDNDWSDNDE